MPEVGSVIFLNGVYGVGKSSTLEHIGDQLAGLARPFSLFDVDWFHRSWPPGADDPDNVTTEALNIAAVWDNYRRVGTRQPVISGVIATSADRTRYANAFGLPVRPVLLWASPETVKQRLSARYSEEQGAALRWHLDRHADLAERLRDSRQYETVIDTDGITPADAARAVLAHFEVGHA